VEGGDAKTLAQQFFNLAYNCHLEGDIPTAVELYQKSLEIYPSSEAYAFLGWALSFSGQYEEAIELCKHAIELDPDFGNPWNDIGAYLIELGKYEEAIPYLEQATESPKYDSYCYPFYNLGRVYLNLGQLYKARMCLERSKEANPEFVPALETLEELKYKVN